MVREDNWGWYFNLLNIEIMIKHKKGNLLQMADTGMFNLIAHGCNTQSVMGAGIAPQMANKYGADRFPLELIGPNINKLGQVDISWSTDYEHYIANLYTQAFPGRAMGIGQTIPLDYDAIRLCFRKLNFWVNNQIEVINEYSTIELGLPFLGAGLAGGNIHRIIAIASEEFDMDNVNVTFVEFDNSLEWVKIGSEYIYTKRGTKNVQLEMFKKD